MTHQPPSDPEHSYPHHEGWEPLAPERLPRPTYWPAVMAVGIMTLLWGLLGSMILTGAGVLLFIVSVIGWIKELRIGPTERAE
jgi:hypothetical protein